MVVMPLGHKQRAAERRPGLGSYFFAALSTARAPEAFTLGNKASKPRGRPSFDPG